MDAAATAATLSNRPVVSSCAGADSARDPQLAASANPTQLHARAIISRVGVARSVLRTVVLAEPSYEPETIVKVTVRVSAAPISTLGDAMRRYVMGSDAALSEEIPVTTSLAAVDSATLPAVDAPAGAPSCTSSDTPSGSD